ncbi:MAG: SDR family oxidoreductase [Firmicutes bacterium]|nr:SDR family oxidoreductase [Bacillota bacterium]
MADFQNKVAVVTGAANGIGKEISKSFAQAGAKVVLVDLQEDALRQAAKDLGLKEREYLLVAADISKEKDVQNYVNRAVDTFGNIDIFINNAGIEGAIAPVAEYPTDKLDAVIAVNIRGTFLGLKYVLQVMEKCENGVIINMSSIGGLKGMPNTSVYVASKFAIIGMTRSAAVEYASKNIRINAVCPAPTNTRMMRSIEAGSDPANPGAAKDLYTSFIPIGRYGETIDIARAVLFLASDQASFITGASLPVDGGMTA